MARLRTLIAGDLRARRWKIKSGVLMLWDHPHGSAAEIRSSDLGDPVCVARCIDSARARYRGPIDEAIGELEAIRARWRP